MELFKKILQHIFDAGMYLNIVALLPQPVQIFLDKNADGVSIWMWIIFFVFQAAISAHGKLNLNSTSMFLGMGGSAIVSLLTVILCMVY